MTGFDEAGAAIAAALAANGVEELFTMPGDAFPVLEAIAQAETRGTPAPRIATCLHETVALAAAHGHHMVSRVPQACLFHVDVGIQMAGGMLHNAQRAHAGVIILGGRTPATWDGSLRGGRVIDMHWVQDRRDVGAGLRDYVKWSYDLTRPEPLAHVIQRAATLAASEPAGPVYVSLLREMLMEPFPGELLPVGRQAPPRATVPDPAALAELADLLVGAERPIAVAGSTGRNQAAFAALGALADAAGLPVFTRGARANLSSDHPMHAGSDHGRALGEADLVLLLDVDVPWTPLFHRLHPDANVAQIDLDPLKEKMGLWSFPVDLALRGDTSVTLPLLTQLVLERQTRTQAEAAATRREQAGSEQAARRRGLADRAASGGAGAPVPVARLAAQIGALVDDDTIVVDDCTTALATTAQYIPTRQPGCYFQPMGSSMGWGAGAALGAKLASPGATVIDVNAEGNFLSGAPEAALWTSARMGAPVLHVIFNNSQYAAIKLGLMHEYPDSALARSGTALELDRAPDLVRLAQSAGAYGERVEDSTALQAGLERGLTAVRGGQSAVIDVRVEPL